MTDPYTDHHTATTLVGAGHRADCLTCDWTSPVASKQRARVLGATHRITHGPAPATAPGMYPCIAVTDDGWYCTQHDDAEGDTDAEAHIHLLAEHDRDATWPQLLLAEIVAEEPEDASHVDTTDPGGWEQAYARLTGDTDDAR